MTLSDIQYPEYFGGLQLLPGPKFFKGSWMYFYAKDGNSWEVYQVHDVISINIADHLVTPEAGENFRTDWFDVLILANNYKLQCMMVNDAQPYFFLNWRWLDEQDNDVTNVTFDGIGKGSPAFSTAGAYNLPIMCLKVSLLTVFPTNPADVEGGPLPGTSASGLVVRWMLGGNETATTPMVYNPGSTVKRCVTFTPLDELHAYFVYDIFGITDFEAANNYMKTHGDPIPSDYPVFVPSDLPQDYDPSTPGGGDGNYSDESDPIDFPDVPTGGALACGAIHAFNVTSGIITQLFQKLWSTSVFDMATWQKLVSSPLDCIVSLHALPVSPVQGALREIWFGNFNTGISQNIVGNQYITVDCGYIDILKFFGSAMDFSPYTKISIYLPFSGIHDLATEDVQASRVHVKYNIDVLTGDCNIQVKCGISVLYKFTGNCKMSIPVTARDDNALGNTIKGSLGMIGGAIVGGAIGNAPGAIAGATLSAAASVAMHKETVSRSGEITSNVGLMDDFTPYLIIHRPQQSLAVNYNKFKGYPSNLTLTLGSCQGYTEVEYVHLTGIDGATDTELEEIETLLKGGVII